VRGTLGIIYRLGKVHFKDTYVWMRAWIYLLTLIVRPATQVAFFGVMARFVTGQADVSFWLIGNSLQSSAVATLYPIADTLVTERRNGTLPLLVMAPLDKFLLFAGRSWVHGLHGLVVSAVTLTLAALAFQMDFSLAAWGPLALAIVVSVVSMSAMGTALGSLGLLAPDVNFIANVASGVLLALAGVNFPLGDMPHWLQHISLLLPLTRGLAAARLAVAGSGSAATLLSLQEFGVAALWLGLGYLAFRWIEGRARRDASLELY